MAVDIQFDLDTIYSGIYGQDIRIAIWDALQRIANNSNKNGEDITALWDAINEGGGGGRSVGISMTDPKKIDDTIKAPMMTGYSCLDGMAWRSEEVTDNGSAH